MSPVPAENSRSLNVLVVDDEALIRWSLAESLTDAGHSVTEASDGAEAIAQVSDGTRFDAILLDYRLPDSNDLGLLQTIRERQPGAAVVMMTAFGTPEVTAGALKLGAFRVVPKPFDVHDMVDLVAQAHRAARDI
ncbi:MAG TPA: response regulator [Vicinamibacterales bacterium]|nr:response regulator [Vicinamibacterales bacterium]